MNESVNGHRCISLHEIPESLIVGLLRNFGELTVLDIVDILWGKEKDVLPSWKRCSFNKQVRRMVNYRLKNMQKSKTIEKSVAPVYKRSGKMVYSYRLRE